MLHRHFWACAAVLWMATAAVLNADATDEFIRAEMKRQNIPGLSLAVVKDGKVVKAAGYGLANRRTQVAATPETVYKIASVSKQFIALDWPAVRPSGAFLSTVLDLAKWDAVLYTDAVLTEAMRRQMWTPAPLNDGTSYPYGFGWLLNREGARRQVSHSGGLPGFVAQYRRYLDDRVTVIVRINLDDVDDEAIATGVAELHLPDRP